MVAEGPGVDLHHHPVLDAHRRHLGQHLGAEQLGVLRAPIASDDAAEQGFRLGGREVGGAGGGVAVVGGGGAGGAEVGAALAVRGEIAGPAPHILSR